MVKQGVSLRDRLLEDSGSSKTPTKVYIGWFLAFVMGLVGGVFGGYATWVYDDGHTVVWGSCIGFVVLFSITVAFAGPGEYLYRRLTVELKPPEWDRVATVGWSTFDLYVTVHRITNMYNPDIAGILQASKQQRFVELKVGRLVDAKQYFSVQMNPVKRTCVSPEGIYEECFHFAVSPTDDTLRIVVWDQDVVADDVCGVADVRIMDDVLGKGFPQQAVYKLRHSDRNDPDEIRRDHAWSEAGNVIISFAPGARFSQQAAHRISEKNKPAYQAMVDNNKTLIDHSQRHYGDTYGTWATSTV